MVYFLWACGLGAISAVSLPLGSWIGLRFKFTDWWISVLAAFGAGALLAALSVELVAPTALALVGAAGGPEADLAREEFLALIAGCLGGGFAYVWLDGAVNSRGGFIRRPSTNIRHDQRQRARERRALRSLLSRVSYFEDFPDSEVDRLLPELEAGSFADGESVCRQGESVEDLFLILEGELAVRAEGEEIARLGPGRLAPGLLPVMTNAPHFVSGVADGELEVLRISKSAFNEMRRISPKFDKRCREEAADRLVTFDALVRRYESELLNWSARAKDSLGAGAQLPTFPVEETTKRHGGSPLAVWLGMVLDGLPESLVIGAGMTWALRSISDAGGEPSFVSVIPFTFLAGLFLSNFPEALSSSANMKRHGMRPAAILGLWVSLMAITAVGAGVGYLLAGQLSSTWTVLFEGLSAGAMLTMIVAAMIPEAVGLGSPNSAGLSTLLGFLSAIAFKLLE